MTPQHIKAAPVKKTIHVEAPPQRAFDVFTAQFGRWWPKSHHIGAAEMKDAVIEPKVGGRWYETGVDGSSCDWGTVTAWESPSRVAFTWRIHSQYKIDETVDSEVEVRFFADGDGTRVELEHRIAATDAEQIRASVDSPGGWGTLLGLYADFAKAG